MEEKQYDEFGRVIRANRSQLKREREHIKEFAQDLLKLPRQQYPLLPINEVLIAALIEGKRLSGNALKRHLSFLTRLIDEQGFEDIQKAHIHINHPYLNDPLKIKRIQNEIKRLLNNDADIYNNLIEQYAEFDIQHVRQLVRASIKIQSTLTTDERVKPDKHQKQLQKYLSGLALNQH